MCKRWKRDFKSCHASKHLVLSCFTIKPPPKCSTVVLRSPLPYNITCNNSRRANPKQPLSHAAVFYSIIFLEEERRNATQASIL